MANNLRACLWCLAVAVLMGQLLLAQTKPDPESQLLDEEIEQLTNEKAAAIVERELAPQEGEKKIQEVEELVASRDAATLLTQQVMIGAAGMVVVQTVAFVLYVRRRHFFDKPAVEWIEGRQYVFAFVAYKDDDQGTKRAHYQCPFCDEVSLSKGGCKDHLKDGHQGELGRYKDE